VLSRAGFGESEAGQRSVVEARHGADPCAREGEYQQPVCVGDVGLRVPDVKPNPGWPLALVAASRYVVPCRKVSAWKRAAGSRPWYVG
jgi:hypothetical protein